jgi:hypothetical protein
MSVSSRTVLASASHHEKNASTTGHDLFSRIFSFLFRGESAICDANCGNVSPLSFNLATCSAQTARVNRSAIVRLRTKNYATRPQPSGTRLIDGYRCSAG